MAEDWLSLSEVGRVLGVHPSTVRLWADQGKLPVHRTQGGHRRFLRSEVDLLMAAETAGSVAEMDQVIKNALRQTRLRVLDGDFIEQPWYQKLDEDARDQYRRGGRTLLQGLTSYLSSDEKNGRDEARAIGFEYASIGRRSGLSTAEAVFAYLFFRSMLTDAMLSVYESASVRSSQAWGDMFRKVTGFTDQVLVTLLETYEGFNRSSR